MFTLVGAGFLAIGILFLVMGRRAVAAAKAEKSWPTVMGKVATATYTRSNDDDARHGFGYYPKVTYEYSVGGASYTGSRIGVVPSQGLNHMRVEQVMRQHQPGTQVAVHYDPANPSNSTLRPAAGGAGLMKVLAILLIVFGTPLFLIGLLLGGH